MRRYSVIPRQNNQLTIDTAMLKLLRTIVATDCKLSSQKDGSWAELTVQRHGRRVCEFEGSEELIEPLVDICDLWSRKKSELCPPHVNRIQHRDALIRRLLEHALCGEDEVPGWLRDFSLHDLAFAFDLVRYRGFSLDDVGSLDNE